MRTSWIALAKRAAPLIAVLACVSCSTPVPAPATSAFTSPSESRALTIILGSGDALSIKVWENDDLTRDLIVDASGDIDFPLIGQVHVLGMTIDGLKKQLADKLTAYIVEPKVEINVTSLASQTIHILGEVERAGSITLTKNLYPWEAISAAGGFTDEANQGKVVLIRIEDGKPLTKVLDLDSKRLAKSGSFENIAYLRSGDIVYVPRTKLGDAEAFMNHIKTLVSPFVTVEQAIVLGPQVADAINNKDSSGNANNVVIASPSP